MPALFLFCQIALAIQGLLQNLSEVVIFANWRLLAVKVVNRLDAAAP